MMQEMRSRLESTLAGGGSKSIPRPNHLYSKAVHNHNLINNNNSVMASQNFINNNYNGGGNLSKSVDNCWTGASKSGSRTSLSFCNNNVAMGTPSSEEDNSPTEMNSCRKFIEKPPLVKRLTMALLLKTSEDSRPLMCNSQNSNLNNYNKNSNTKGSCHSIGEAGYVNEGTCELDQIISSKFGDSCRKSLMSMATHHQDTINWSIDHLNNQEFNFKKNLLRETSSGEFLLDSFQLECPCCRIGF